MCLSYFGEFSTLAGTGGQAEFGFVTVKDSHRADTT